MFLQAKHVVELRKLKDFDVYDEVEDFGQPCISTKWVKTRKYDKMKARLVARGFEEPYYIKSNSPTVAKTTMRILLATATSNGWAVKSSDITPAFLPGKQIQRDLFIKPPPEAAQSNGALWKLKKTLYGLADAVRQFYDRAYYNRRNETKRNEILRNTAKYCEILRNMKKYGQITTKNAKNFKPYHKYSLPWTQCGRQSSHGHTEKAEVCTTD